MIKSNSRNQAKKRDKSKQNMPFLHHVNLLLFVAAFPWFSYQAVSIYIDICSVITVV